MAPYKSIHAAICKIEIVISSDARTNAAGYRRLLEDPEFIVTLVVVQFVLSLLKPICFCLFVFFVFVFVFCFWKRQIAIWFLFLKKLKT